MTFQPGQSGNPTGKPKQKPLRDALLLAIKRVDKDDKIKLNAMAEALVEKALAGDVMAFREIADRVEGKVAQQTIVTGDEDGGPVRLEEIRRSIVDPRHSDSAGIQAAVVTGPV
jgi:hypothetical protein